MAPYPFTLSITILNEAGETVKTLSFEQTSATVGDIHLYIDDGDGDPPVPADDGGGYVVGGDIQLEINLPGVETPWSIGKGGTSFFWTADNDQGQDVDNGVYYIKIEERDLYGHVMTNNKQITVLRADEYVEMRVFNNAGERVRTVRVPGGVAGDFVGLEMGDKFEIDQTGTVPTSIPFIYGNGATDNMEWDGKNEAGIAVSTGVYEMQVIVQTKEGPILEASKKIIILNQGRDFLSDVEIHPNPYTPGILPQGTYIWWGGTDNGTAVIKIYNFAGELVTRLEEDLSMGTVFWDFTTTQGSKVATGKYIVIVEAIDSIGNRNIKWQKLVILGY